jgi:dTDP-4-dehydrorhamnose reductase
MKKAVTGYDGKMGSEFVKRGYIPIKSDITNTKDLFQEVKEIDPEVIVHCAALTDVRYCEENEREAFKVNVRGTVNVADSFSGLLVYPSSCHVFSGQHYIAYNESHTPDPVNVYGMTKLMGEVVSRTGFTSDSIVVRTSTLFTARRILDIVERLKSGENMEISSVLVRSFMYIPHFVDAVEQVIEKKLDGTIEEDTIHIAGNYTERYYDFYQQIIREFGLDQDLVKEFRYKRDHLTSRPFRAGLNVNRAEVYGIRLRSSHEGLREIKNEHSI